jgi:4-hydroxy-3-polyprenylbenzoate decarboxylase
MAYRELRDFIARLEREGELKRITAPVDVRLELSAITDIVSKEIGPALLFENVTGPAGRSAMPVLINQFGSTRRMELALEVDSLESIAGAIEGFLETQPPRGLWEGLRKIPEVARLLRIAPATVRSGPCQEIVRTGDEIRLSDIPVITAWPEDGGPFITLGCVFTKDPVNGKRNVGMYRLQVYDDRTTGMHWHKHHQGAEHADKTGAGEKMPVAVVIGADPATTFSAAAPLPPGIDELLFAGFLRNAPVEMVPCKTVPLEVPAHAEIVLEGWVDPRELRLEGPFGDHTGFYSMADQYPVFHLTAITHRKNPIYATTIVGPPPMEDCWMGYAIERIFLPLLKKVVPEMVDYHMPFEGVFHNLVLVSINKRFPGHARKVMHALWGLGQMAFAKTIVVFDADVNVKNPSEAAFVALANIDPERDMEFSFGPAETLDHASRLLHYGSKVGIDATRKGPSEGFTRPWPEKQVMDPAVVEKVRSRWKELGL